MNNIFIICIAAIFTIVVFIFEWNNAVTADPPFEKRYMLRTDFTNLESSFDNSLSASSRNFFLCVQENRTNSKTCFVGKNKNAKKNDLYAEYYMKEPYTKEQQTIHYPAVYNTVLQPNKLCDKNPSILLVIHCGPNQFKERYSVRNTWGKIDSYNGYSFKLGFFMGMNEDNNTENELLNSELYKYNDIIQFSHKNTYLNNTITAMLCYKWILNNCPNILYMIKADMDMYVNIKTLVDNNLVKYGENIKENTAIGFIIRHGAVIRDMRHKNSIFPEFYPKDEWPNYLSGCLFIYTIDVVKKVLFLFFYYYSLL